mgnify:CR=1 FL=1
MEHLLAKNMHEFRKIVKLENYLSTKKHINSFHYINLNMDRRRLIPLILLLTLLAVVAVAYSVAIGLEETDIDQLGATSKVSVTCPVSGCSISRVKWMLTNSPPYYVDKVKIYWTPASNSGSYTVYVELYNDGSVISSGSVTQDGSDSQVITEVDVGNVDPKDVQSVRIVIVQD